MLITRPSCFPPLPAANAGANGDSAVVDFIRGMENRLGDKIEGVDRKIDRIEGNVSSLERRMDRNDDEFDSRVIRLINQERSQGPPGGLGQPPPDPSMAGASDPFSMFASMHSTHGRPPSGPS